MHLPGVAAELADEAVWRATVEELQRRRPGDLELLERCRDLLASGAAARLVEEVLAHRYRPAPPRRIELNRAGRRRKVVYQLQPLDELLCRVLNRVLQPRVAAHLSDRCHSFQPGRSAVTAFASLLAAPRLAELSSLHCDISDFFNSIDVDHLLAGLPASLREDAVLMGYLEPLLRGSAVLRGGTLVEEPRKGVMAGTPLAPLLTNLYLRDLDAALQDGAVASARYSDDILVLGSPAQVDSAERLIRQHLGARGLRLNEAKTRRGAAGEPWDFLGLRHDGGRVGLSANTCRRLQAKVRRRGRRLSRHRIASGCSPERICALFVASLNRKLYGVRSRGDVEFSWARWFFPLLSSDTELAGLDARVQRELRWAACGSRRERSRAQVPYAMLRAAGYLPLVTAYHAYRRKPAAFSAFLESRCRGTEPHAARL